MFVSFCVIIFVFIYFVCHYSGLIIGSGDIERDAVHRKTDGGMDEARSGLYDGVHGMLLTNNKEYSIGLLY